MPEVTQYNFTPREAGEALLRSAGIKAGKWSFGVNFGVNIGNIAPDNTSTYPSVLAVVQGLVLQKAPDDAPDADMIIDASKL